MNNISFLLLSVLILITCLRDVYAKLEFTKTPEDLKEGEMVEFNCVAGVADNITGMIVNFENSDGVKVKKLRWVYETDRLVLSGTKEFDDLSVSKDVSSRTLSFTFKAGIEDRLRYECLTILKDTDVISRTINLNMLTYPRVQYLGLEVKRTNSSALHKAGDEAEISCVIYPGNGTDVSFTAPGNGSDTYTRIVMNVDSFGYSYDRLVLRKVLSKEDNEVKANCSGSNGAGDGEVASTPMEVMFGSAVVNRHPKDNGSILVGDFIFCAAEGNPVPKVEMFVYENTSVMLKYHGQSMTNSPIASLQIPLDAKLGFYEYFCTSENSYGNDTSPIFLFRVETLPVGYIVGGIVIFLAIVWVLVVIFFPQRSSKKSLPVGNPRM